MENQDWFLDVVDSLVEFCTLNHLPFTAQKLREVLEAQRLERTAISITGSSHPVSNASLSPLSEDIRADPEEEPKAMQMGQAEGSAELPQRSINQLR